MSNILYFAEYKKSWLSTRQHMIPKKPQAAGVSVAKLVAMAIALIAINIVSGSHTIPTVANTVHSIDPNIRAIVGIAGFLSIEFTLFLMMVAPVPGHTRKIVIALALSAAIVANLYSTIQAISNDPWTLVVGVVIGLFGPLANVAFGEVFHREFEKVNIENKRIEGEYQKALSDLNSTIRTAYTKYLKSVGITDPTIQLQYMAGDTGTIEVSQPVPVSVPNSEPVSLPNTQYQALLPVSVSVPSSEAVSPVPGISSFDSNISSGINSGRRTSSGSIRRTTNSVATDGRATGNSSADILADQLIANGDIGLTYKQIREKYGVGPNTVSKAVAIVRERQGQ